MEEGKVKARAGGEGEESEDNSYPPIMGAGDESCFHSLEIILKVAMEPIEYEDAMSAVKKQLNSILFKFNDVLDGIPLSFAELRFPEGKEYGRILGDQPWIHIDVLTKMVIFKPTIGAKVHGKITAVRTTTLTLTLYSLKFHLIVHSLTNRYLKTMCQY